METIDSKEDLHSKNNIKSKERYGRRQAWKKFKKLKQQLVNEKLKSGADETLFNETTRLHASIAKACMKANDDSWVIRKIVKKRNEKMVSSLKKLIDGGPNNSSKHLKTMDNYRILTSNYYSKRCKGCGVPFYRVGRPKEWMESRFPVHWGHNRFWYSSKIISHWLEHKDAELAQIYSKDGIEGIVKLDDKRVAEFFKQLKVLFSRKIHYKVLSCYLQVCRKRLGTRTWCTLYNKVFYLNRRYDFNRKTVPQSMYEKRYSFILNSES
jgi:spermidine/putrescine-binding protein